MCFNIKLFFSYIKKWFRSIGNIKKNEKNIFNIKYKYNGNKYLIPIVVKWGPKPVIQKVLDEKENDVTKEFMMYYGPYSNFNGIKTTPNMLGYKQLTILYNNEKNIFSNNENILLENIV